MRLRLHLSACSDEKSRSRLKCLFALSAALFVMLCGTPLVSAQNAQLVNANKNGSDSGNGTSLTSSGTVSADGRLVAFTSKASDLTALPDGNAAYDVFVRDLRTGITNLVSVNVSGTGTGNGDSGIFNDRGFIGISLALSADGRFVAFSSAASNLVANDRNNLTDVFVRDLETGVMILVSANAARTDSGNGNATFPYLSADGSMVGFRSAASDLVLNDTNNSTDVFVRDLRSGVTRLVSVNSAGTASGNGQSSFSTFSVDGRFVAFASSASDLVANDSNGAVVDIFVRDLQTGRTRLISASLDGAGSGNNHSAAPSISADGRFVAFNSRATNLVSHGDTNGTDDVFVRDLFTDKTTLVSVNKSGTATGGRNSHLQSPMSISANGNFIAFVSQAPDLVDNDTNGNVTDVFVRDVAAGVTKLASANSAGTGSGDSFSASNEVSISADGTFVTFDSLASDLVAGMPVGLAQQVFVRDMRRSQTTLVSPNVQRTGGGHGNSYGLTISADGSTVVFLSDASDLVANDTNNAQDVFAYTLPLAACTYFVPVGTIGLYAAATGDTFTVNVSTQPGCNWTVTSRRDYITVASGASGTGSGTVTLTVAANDTGSARIGIVNIAGQDVHIMQAERSRQAPLIKFDRVSYQVSEGEERGKLVITRTGDLSGTVSVRYETQGDLLPWSTLPCSAPSPLANARCDYSTTIDTVTFAPGEARKEISIPLVDDGHAERDEMVQVYLNWLNGTPFPETISTAYLIIADNDTPGTPNPIFTTPFFVRQHYLDFLSREPEAGEPWSGVLNRCPNVDNLSSESPSAACDRIAVSASFFGSPEFRLKGFYVFKFYRVAFNRLPLYEEIIAAMRSVTGATEQEVYAKRVAFVEDFMAQREFRERYSSMDNSSYVNALLDQYGLQRITTPDPLQPEQGTKVTLTRSELKDRIALTGAQALTRAQVLRAVVESDEVAAAEFNRAFVAMQYYGYLRRMPEQDGYQAWLRVLDEDPKNVRLMINGFMNSVEYRLRFGR